MLFLAPRFCFRLIRHDNKRFISVFELRKTYHHNKLHEVEMKVSTIVPNIYEKQKIFSRYESLKKAKFSEIKRYIHIKTY